MLIFLLSVPPKIDSSNIVSTPEVVINNTIILHCPASGNPIPEISWYRDEDAITTNTSRMSLLDDSWRLKISSAQTSDTARYKCRAENIAGEAEKYFDLQVLGESFFLPHSLCQSVCLSVWLACYLSRL